VSVDPEGQVHATILALMFAWLPPEFSVPVETPVTFHLTSIDVTHGFEIVRTNGQSMVIPGYISQFTTQFNQPGEYLIACNEYCGIGHHGMMAKMQVVPKAEWKAPVAPVAAASESEETHHDP
jgi:cytochrome c oxidase subunit 2